MLFFQLTLFVFPVIAQDIEFSKANFKTDKEGLKEALKNIERGDKYFFMEEKDAYTHALMYYFKANRFNPNNSELNYKMGVSYLYRTDQKLGKSVMHFEKSLQLNPEVAYDVNFHLAKAYHLNLQFDQAILEYDKYKKHLPEELLTEEERRLNKYIQECVNGKKIIKNPVRVEIKNAGPILNSPGSDHSPLISADESMMIFTSRRENTTGGKKDSYDNQYFEDIYVSYNIESVWKRPTNIGSPLNTSEHDATVGLAPDGQQLFVYKGNKNRGDIYVCELNGDKWTAPLPLPSTINSEFRERSACFSHDGNTIFFVSDRLGDNFGGSDIYVSHKKKDGNWGYAKNIGRTINTQYDEEGVFMHPDGRTLYFSSQGHKSMGGYDIFRSVKQDNGEWSEPENIGYPINTAGDDVYFVMSASGQRGYYSSVREDGFGEKDIYVINFLTPEEPSEENAVLLTLLKGVVLDEKTNEPIEADIEIVDNEKNEVISRFKSNSKTGKYLISLPSGKNYGIAVEVDGYLFHSENFNLPKSEEYQEIAKDVGLKKITKGSRIVLRNIFFDYARATLIDESVTELDRLVELLNKNSEIRIEISGHTDNQSSLKTNQRLSTARAKSVVDYLILKGIDPARLEYKGYAFNQPIVSNDTEEGRAQNRRVEFKIISE